VPSGPYIGHGQERRWNKVGEQRRFIPSVAATRSRGSITRAAVAIKPSSARAATGSRSKFPTENPEIRRNNAAGEHDFGILSKSRMIGHIICRQGVFLVARSQT